MSYVYGVIIAALFGLSSLQAQESSLRITNAQDFVASLEAEIDPKNIIWAVDNKEAFVAELVDLRILSAAEAEQALAEPAKVLQALPPAGNASHYYRYRPHRGYYRPYHPYQANPIWWLALLVLLTTPAYY